MNMLIIVWTLGWNYQAWAATRGLSIDELRSVIPCIHDED